jgi:DNA polymerase-3 subunit delta
MLLKGKQAVTFSKRPKPDIWAVLAFGEDEGLAADAASNLLRGWTPKSEDLEVTTLDDDAIKKDASLLFDSLEAVSLLGGARAIRVRTSGDKIAKLLVEAINAGDADPQRFAAKLIIQAGSLQKRSKLRAAAESAKHTACLQLFADDAGDVQSLVETKLLEAGASIEPAALAAFVGDLPGHRGIANAEIEKLSLYAHGLGRAINLGDIRALSATDIDHALSAAVKATLSGHPEQAHTALDRLETAGTSPISILRSLQSETLRMLDAHSKITSGNANPGMKLRPPVWNSEWPAFRQRLNVWSAPRLRRVLERLYDAEHIAKVKGGSAGPTVRMLMNDLVRVAENTK